jgi:hypothetical protein
MKLKLLGLLLLIPVFFVAGKLAGNYLDDAMSANRDKPLLELQAQQEKEFAEFKQRQAEKLAADNERTAEQCRILTEGVKALPPEYWQARQREAE